MALDFYSGHYSINSVPQARDAASFIVDSLAATHSFGVYGINIEEYYKGRPCIDAKVWERLMSSY